MDELASVKAFRYFGMKILSFTACPKCESGG